MVTADYTDEDIFSNLAYFARQWRSGLVLLPEAKEREGREYENPGACRRLDRRGRKL